MPSSTIKINQAMLKQLIAETQASPRRRKNLNFHDSDQAVSHRLLIAIEPDSYIPPHCHADPNKDETITVVKGRLGLICFDQAGNVTDSVELCAAGDTIGITIPHGMWHSLVALESGSVFFETKAGPYAPPADNERVSWAPAENTPQAVDYLAGMAALFR